MPRVVFSPSWSNGTWGRHTEDDTVFVEFNITIFFFGRYENNNRFALSVPPFFPSWLLNKDWRRNFMPREARNSLSLSFPSFTGPQSVAAWREAKGRKGYLQSWSGQCEWSAWWWRQERRRAKFGANGLGHSWSVGGKRYKLGVLSLHRRTHTHMWFGRWLAPEGKEEEEEVAAAALEGEIWREGGRKGEREEGKRHR